MLYCANECDNNQLLGLLNYGNLLEQGLGCRCVAFTVGGLSPDVLKWYFSPSGTLITLTVSVSRGHDLVLIYWMFVPHCRYEVFGLQFAPNACWYFSWLFTKLLLHSGYVVFQKMMLKISSMKACFDQAVIYDFAIAFLVHFIALIVLIKNFDCSLAG